jgi:thiol-disulfide isomerase/thioredoxin
MPSSTDRQRKQGNDSKVLITTIIVAILLVIILAATMMCGTDPDAPVAVADATATPPPAPRPQTETAEDSARPTSSAEPVEPTIEVGTKPGQLAPDFVLDTLDGGEARLSDFRGKVVLLNFWASWCGPCRMEFPDLVSVYEKNKDRGFEIVAVNLGESKEVAGRFAEQFKLPFPILLDSNAGVARQYQTYSIPTSYFLDRDGVILGSRAGAMTESFVEEVLLNLLGEE